MRMDEKEGSELEDGEILEGEEENQEEDARRSKRRRGEYTHHGHRRHERHAHYSQGHHYSGRRRLSDTPESRSDSQNENVRPRSKVNSSSNEENRRSGSKGSSRSSHKSGLNTSNPHSVSRRRRSHSREKRMESLENKRDSLDSRRHRQNSKGHTKDRYSSRSSNSGGQTSSVQSDDVNVDKEETPKDKEEEKNLEECNPGPEMQDLIVVVPGGQQPPLESLQQEENQKENVLEDVSDESNAPVQVVNQPEDISIEIITLESSDEEVVEMSLAPKLKESTPTPSTENIPEELAAQDEPQDEDVSCVSSAVNNETIVSICLSDGGIQVEREIIITQETVSGILTSDEEDECDGTPLDISQLEAYRRPPSDEPEPMENNIMNQDGNSGKLETNQSKENQCEVCKKRGEDDNRKENKIEVINISSDDEDLETLTLRNKLLKSLLFKVDEDVNPEPGRNSGKKVTQDSPVSPDSVPSTTQPESPEQVEGDSVSPPAGTGEIGESVSPPGNVESEQSVLPPGNAERKPTVLPPENEKRNQSVLPPGNEKRNQSVLPPGNEKRNQSVLPPGKEKRKQSVVTPGNEKRKQSVVPPGNEESNQSVLPPGNEKSNQSVLPPGNEESNQSVSPPGNEESNQSVSPPGNEESNQSVSPPGNDGGGESVLPSGNGKSGEPTPAQPSTSTATNENARSDTKEDNKDEKKPGGKKEEEPSLEEVEALRAVLISQQEARSKSKMNSAVDEGSPRPNSSPTTRKSSTVESSSDSAPVERKAHESSGGPTPVKRRRKSTSSVPHRRAEWNTDRGYGNRTVQHPWAADKRLVTPYEAREALYAFCDDSTSSGAGGETPPLPPPFAITRRSSSSPSPIKYSRKDLFGDDKASTSVDGDGKMPPFRKNTASTRRRSSSSSSERRSRRAPLKRRRFSGTTTTRTAESSSRPSRKRRAYEDPSSSKPTSKRVSPNITTPTPPGSNDTQTTRVVTVTDQNIYLNSPSRRGTSGHSSPSNPRSPVPSPRFNSPTLRPPLRPPYHQGFPGTRPPQPPPPDPRSLPKNDLRKKLLKNQSLRKSRSEQDKRQLSDPPKSPPGETTETFNFPEFGVVDTDWRTEVNKRLETMMNSDDITIRRTINVDQITSSISSCITWAEPISPGSSSQEHCIPSNPIPTSTFCAMVNRPVTPPNTGNTENDRSEGRLRSPIIPRFVPPCPLERISVTICNDQVIPLSTEETPTTPPTYVRAGRRPPSPTLHSASNRPRMSVSTLAQHSYSSSNTSLDILPLAMSQTQTSAGEVEANMNTQGTTKKPTDSVQDTISVFLSVSGDIQADSNSQGEVNSNRDSGSETFGTPPTGSKNRTVATGQSDTVAPTVVATSQPEAIVTTQPETIATSQPEAMVTTQPEVLAASTSSSKIVKNPFSETSSQEVLTLNAPGSTQPGKIGTSTSTSKIVDYASTDTSSDERFILKASGLTQPETIATTQPETTAKSQPETIASSQPEEIATTPPEAAATTEPESTATIKPEPTATIEPEETATTQPEATATTEPESTASTQPEATATTEPETTATTEPEATATTQPETIAISQPEAIATSTPSSIVRECPPTVPSSQEAFVLNASGSTLGKSDSGELLITTLATVATPAVVTRPNLNVSSSSTSDSSITSGVLVKRYGSKPKTPKVANAPEDVIVATSSKSPSAPSTDSSNNLEVTPNSDVFESSVSSSDVSVAGRDLPRRNNTAPAGANTQSVPPPNPLVYVSKNVVDVGKQFFMNPRRNIGERRRSLTPQVMARSHARGAFNPRNVRRGRGGVPRSAPSTPFTRLIIPVRVNDSTSEDEEEEESDNVDNAKDDVDKQDQDKETVEALPPETQGFGKEFQQSLEVFLRKTREESEKRRKKTAPVPVATSTPITSANCTPTASAVASLTVLSSVQASPSARPVIVSANCSVSPAKDTPSPQSSGGSVSELPKGKKASQNLSGGSGISTPPPNNPSTNPNVGSPRVGSTRNALVVSTSKAMIENLTQKIIESRDQLALSAKEKELLQIREHLYGGYREILHSLQQHVRLTNLDKCLETDITDLESKLEAAKKRQTAARSRMINTTQKIKEKSRDVLAKKIQCATLAQDVKKLGEKVIGENLYKVTDLFCKDMLDTIKNLEHLHFRQTQEIQQERGTVFPQILGDFDIPPQILAHYIKTNCLRVGSSLSGAVTGREDSGTMAIANAPALPVPGAPSSLSPGPSPVPLQILPSTTTATANKSDGGHGGGPSKESNLCKKCSCDINSDQGKHTANSADAEGNTNATPPLNSENWRVRGLLTRHALGKLAKKKRSKSKPYVGLGDSCDDETSYPALPDIPLPSRMGLRTAEDIEAGRCPRRIDPMIQLCMEFLMEGVCPDPGCRFQHV